MNISSSAYHQPFQSSSSSLRNEKEGRTLLDLLRTRDKLLIGKNKNTQLKNNQARDDDDREEIEQVEHELTDRLTVLNGTIRRCGLFTSSERARSFYNHASDRSTSATEASIDRHGDNNNNDGEGSSSAAAGGSSKKRKRKKGSGGTGGGSGGGATNSASGLAATSYGIHLDSQNSNNNTASYLSSASSGEKQDLDEGLIVTAICRILGVTVGRKKKTKDDQKEKDVNSIPRSSGSASNYGLMSAALNIISSICNHAKDGMVPFLLPGDNMTRASIEGDMIGSIGSHLLDSLGDNILFLHYKSCHNADDDNEMLFKGCLTGCFMACASVTSLLGTRLSRAEKAVQSLRDATLFVLNNTSCGHGEESQSVSKAATALLATLILAGNSEGTPPSKIWTQSVNDGVVLMRWAIHDFFPMPSLNDGNHADSIKAEAKANPTLWKEHENWMSIAKNAPTTSGKNAELDLGNGDTDSHRSQALQSRIQHLTQYIHSLLKMENYPLHQQHRLNGTLLLPLDSILDISEILLSFTLAAEGKHRRTKSRLRSTPVQDGLLSPNAAVAIGPNVRLCGHMLLDVTVESCRGGAGILGRARRLVGMTVANLQSSCSLALVSVVDGRRGVASGSGEASSRMMGSWLRGSIPLRIKSIETFHSVAISLGSGVMSSMGTAKSISRALVLVGGCLLEQVQGSGGGGETENRNEGNGLTTGMGGDDEWGTLGDRAKLVETSSSALASCIAAFGGLIPNNVRSTLDSITHTCLSTVYSRGGSSIFAYSHAKRSILQLGMNCVCVPWGDGGRCSSTVMDIVRTASTMLRNDPDVSVASAALSTLCAFDALMTPRAPPIMIPTRGSSVDVDGTGMMTKNNGSGGLTASALMQGMNESKMEMVDSKEAKGERKAGKKSDKKKKSSKKAKKDTPTNHATGSKALPDDQKVHTAGIAEENTAVKKSLAANKSLPEESNKNADEKTANDYDDELQNDNSNKLGKMMVAKSTTSNRHDDDAMDTSSVGAEDKQEMKNEENSNNEDSDGSLDDFPEIVDEDPDEDDM